MEASVKCLKPGGRLLLWRKKLKQLKHQRLVLFLSVPSSFTTVKHKHTCTLMNRKQMSYFSFVLWKWKQWKINVTIKGTHDFVCIFQIFVETGQDVFMASGC